MAATHTPPNASLPAGSRLRNALSSFETGGVDLLEEIATVMEAVDGGEANAADVSKVTLVTSRYGFAADAASVAAIGQLQALRAVIVNNKAAIDQACNRLR